MTNHFHLSSKIRYLSRLGIYMIFYRIDCLNNSSHVLFLVVDHRCRRYRGRRRTNVNYYIYLNFIAKHQDEASASCRLNRTMVVGKADSRSYSS